MNKICKACGFSGENVWRDNKYYCASCGAEIDETQPDAVVSAPVPVSAACPICNNALNNTAQNGKCTCALCGATFVPQRRSVGQQNNYTQQSQPAGQVNYQNTPPMTDNQTLRQQLEKKRNENIIWGVILLFLFWPVSIYFFYKVYQISQEIDKL